MSSRRLRRVGFVLWTSLATLILFEGALRFAALFVDPDRPDASEPVVSDASAYRVLAVGDSWVFGAEAPPGRGFVDVVERRLPSVIGRPVQVVNRGRNGANSAHAASVVLDTAPGLRPDAVIVLVGLNNGHNLQGVAELGRRLGEERRSPLRLRSLQALRIAATNLGFEGRAPVALPSIPPMRFADDGACVQGNFAFGDAADAPAAELCRGTPLVQAPLLESPAGREYLERFVDGEPPSSGDAVEDLTYSLLHASARGDAASRGADARRLLELVRGPVDSAREARARYALLRHARETEDWRGVRRHGGALDVWPERGLLRDLGAAEARVLAGDWVAARALLVSAHHRAPGFPDVVDAAFRFPPPARDGRVHDAIEWPWPRRTLRRELARIHGRTGLYESDELRDALSQARHAANPGPTPSADGSKEEWRLHLAARAGRGGSEESVRAARALAASGASHDPVALEYAVEAMRVAGDCVTLLETADRWYAVRGDAHGWVTSVARCLGPDESGRRLAELREAWGPLGPAAAWDALAASPEDPFLLLARHLDAIVGVVGASTPVLVLSYPNPAESFGLHRDVVAAYAASHAVEFVDFQTLFAERFSGAEAASLFAPHGHCNARGYEVMGDEVVRRLAALARR